MSASAAAWARHAASPRSRRERGNRRGPPPVAIPRSSKPEPSWLEPKWLRIILRVLPCSCVFCRQFCRAP
eukprot:1164061-Pyramimonas_sp.AAC.1